MRLLLAVICGFALALTACPKSIEQTDKPVTTCTKVGTSCVYAEGKLGLCVERAPGVPCTGASDSGDCLVCQSQH